MSHTQQILGSLIFLTLSTSMAFAESTVKEHKGFGIGMGVSNALSEYKEKSEDDEGLGFIYFTYQGDRVRLDEEQFAYDVYRREKARFSLVAESNGQGFESDDKTIFKGLNERDSSLELGVEASLSLLGGDLRFAALKDASDAHDGEIFKLSYDKTFTSGKWSFVPKVGVSRFSEEFVDYYYGVNATEVTSDRGIFQGKAATVSFAGVKVDYTISPRFNFTSSLFAVALPDEIKNSSLTKDNSSKLNAFIGVEYKF